MQAHDSAKGILGGRIETLHKLAGALLVEETLDAEAVEAIITGKPRPRAPKPAEPDQAPPAPEEPPAPPVASAPPDGGDAEAGD